MFRMIRFFDNKFVIMYEYCLEVVANFKSIDWLKATS